METKTWQSQYMTNWHHKQQLESLATFSEQLQYWINNIDPNPTRGGCRSESIDNMGPGTPSIYADGVEGGRFRLALDPKTTNDRREFYRSIMEFYRTEYILDNKKIRTLGWSKVENDKRNIAFTVRPLEILKADLQLRLSTASRKIDLLKFELANTTNAIDAVCKIINGASYQVSGEIKELRQALETNSPYDFDFIDIEYPLNKTARLAEVWDLVYYESHLKDTLEMAENDPYVTADKVYVDNGDQIKLAHTQIAILHHYIKQPITRNNAVGIAQKYGQTSGQKLEAIYKDLISPLTRTAKGKNRVKDIETILPLLSGEAKAMANKELVEARKCNKK